MLYSGEVTMPKSWILQSTADVYSNARILTNIRDIKCILLLDLNAGKNLVTQKGDLKGYGTILYHPGGISKILYLNSVQKKYRMNYDSSLKTRFLVHKADGNHIFTHSKVGLFFSDVS